MRNKKNFLAALVFIAAAFFRLTNPNLVEFKSDEAINLFLASQPLFGKPIPPGSTVSSVGILNPPLINYLLFPLALITVDPAGVSLLIGAINSISVVLLFFVYRKYFGEKIALISCLMLALSPWAILYSRKIWAQDLILPFIVGITYFAGKINIEKDDRGWFYYSLLATLLVQLHQSSGFFLALLTLFLIMSSRKINVKLVVLGLIIGIIPAIPYFGYIINNWHNKEAFMVMKERFSSWYSPIIFLRPLQITNQGHFDFLIGKALPEFVNQYRIIWNLRKIYYLEYILIPFGLILAWHNYKKWRFLTYSVFLLPVVYFLLHIEPFLHYFLNVMPFLFLFLAISINKLPQRIGWAVTAAIIILSILYNSAFYGFLNEKKYLPGDYGAIYTEAKTEKENMLKKYKSDKDYREMLLASYLPKDAFYGYYPLGKMLFENKVSPQRVIELNRRIEEAPEDPRTQIELITYYTLAKPEEGDINSMASKIATNSGYREVVSYVTQSKFFRKP